MVPRRLSHEVSAPLCVRCVGPRRIDLPAGSRGLSRKSWTQALPRHEKFAADDQRAEWGEASGRLGARRARASLPRSDLDEQIFDTIRSAFTGRLPLEGRGAVGYAPIFVIGLPETGTRTVASTLSRHPAVALAAENGAFADVLCRAARKTRIDADAICRIAGMSAERIGQAYLDAACRGGNADVIHNVDEQALNFLYVGFILQALPNARVLCVRRGAMDSAWNLFGRALAPPFDYWGASLQGAARLVLLFQRLMGFWRQRFPGRIHEITYEWLAADPEAETRRMLAHCGLDWHPACTMPPIGSDIGEWRDGADQSDAIIAFFAAHGITAD